MVGRGPIPKNNKNQVHLLNSYHLYELEVEVEVEVEVVRFGLLSAARYHN